MRYRLKDFARNWHEAATWLLVLALLFVALALLAYVMGMVTLQRVAPAQATFGYALLAGLAEMGMALGVAGLLYRVRQRIDSR